MNGVHSGPSSTTGGVTSPVQSQTPVIGPVLVPTPLDCLKVILHYLKKEEKEKILRLLFDGPPPLIKFNKFNFRCRTLISEKENSRLSFNGSIDRGQNSIGLSVTVADPVSMSLSVVSDDDFII